MINRESRHSDPGEYKFPSEMHGDRSCLLIASPHIIRGSGRLAQLEERSVYTRKVTSSSLVPPILDSNNLDIRYRSRKAELLPDCDESHGK